MSYVDLNWDFSQWDKDNTNRFQSAGYINNANALVKRILASSNAAAARADLQAADAYYGRAKSALAAHSYNSTFDNARLAYESVLAGARKAGVRVTESQDAFTIVTGRTAAAAARLPGTYVDKPASASEVARGMTVQAHDGDCRGGCIQTTRSELLQEGYERNPQGVRSLP